MAGSYPMVHYSSEARGYMMVLFFAFATFWALRHFIESRRWVWVIIIYFCAFRGVLSRLMYAYFFASSAVWLFVELLRVFPTKRQAIRHFGQCIVVPMVFLCGFYGLFARKILIDTGPPYKVIDILIKAFSYAGGGPNAGIMAMVVSVLTAGLFLAGAIGLGRKKSCEWIFFLLVIFLPGLFLLVKRPEVLFVRYFLLSIAFGLLVVSYLLADLCRRGLALRICVVVVIVLFLVGNGINMSRFYRYGRGSYLEGVRYMADNTDEQVITITSDSKLRNGLLVQYYQRFLPSGKKFLYIPPPIDATNIPMWIILHRIGEPGEIHQNIVDQYDNIYSLKKSLPYSDLSGFGWFLYQKQTASQSDPSGATKPST